MLAMVFCYANDSKWGHISAEMRSERMTASQYLNAPMGGEAPPNQTRFGGFSVPLTALVVLPPTRRDGVLEHGARRLQEGQEFGYMGIRVFHNQAHPEDAAQPPLDPIDEAEAIQILYFPELATLLMELRIATQVHTQFVSMEINRIGADIQEW